MAVKSEEDRSTKFGDVDRTKGDVHGNLKNANSDDDFKYDPTKAPHNKSVDGKPLNTNKDQYNEATRIGNSDGSEAIKTAREKFAKKKDDPPGIASAKEGTKSIKESLNQTDPQRKSQVLPQMYDKFGMIGGMLKSSSSGQQGQSQDQIQSGEPDYYQDLDTYTKDLLISAITHGWAILTRNFGYQKVLENVSKATTGFYTQEELNAINWYDPNFTPTVFRFDRFSPDYQDVLVTSLTLLGQLYTKYGEQQIPFIQPFYKPKTLRTPPKIVTSPSKYSVLRFYPNSEFTTVTFNGAKDISSNSFIKIIGNTLVNNDVVVYAPDVGNNSIKGLLTNSFYYVVQANSSGVKLAAAPAGAPTIISTSTTSTPTTTRVILSGAPVIVNGVNVTAIIVDKYNKLLRKTPDQEGLIKWEAAFQQWLKDPSLTFNNALSKLDDAFRASDEYKQLTSGESQQQVNDVIRAAPVFYTGSDGISRNLSLIIKDKYTTFLKRDPDLKGLSFNIKVLQDYLNTYSFHDAIMKLDSDFKNSSEYKKLNNIPTEKVVLKPVTTAPVFYTDTSGEKYNLSAIITDKFVTYLKRQPDQDGMTFWEGLLKFYIQQYGFVNASNKLNDDFKNSPEYKELQTTNTPKKITTANTNIKTVPGVVNTSPVKIANTSDPLGTNAVLTLIEEYPGYARWDKTDGGIEYMLRTQYLPDFETAELLVVYLSAYSFAADLFSVIPNSKLDHNLLAILLDRYTRKIENDYSDYTLGWGISADRLAEQQDFNSNPETGGSGKNSSMLQQLLPQLQQLMQQTQQNHLPKSVLEQEKMRKLLENFKQKKIENKRMANFADEGVGGDGIAGIGSMFQNGNMGGLLSQMQSFTGGGAGGGGTGGGAAAGNAGSITTNSADGTVTASNNVYVAQTGVVTLNTLIGGTTDGKSIVKTFKTNTPVSVLNAVNPPQSLIVETGGIKIDLKSVIRDKYNTFLKREPDSEGWQLWMNTMQEYLKTMDLYTATMTINKQFTSSAEYAQKNANTVVKSATSSNNQPVVVVNPVKTPDMIHKGYNISAVIRDKYKTFFNRDPDQDGMTFWEGVFRSDIDKLGYESAAFKLNSSFTNSSEYKQKQALAKISTTAKPVPEIKTDNIVGFEGKL